MHWALLTVILSAPAANAASFGLGLGADYWFENTGLFNLTLDVKTPLARTVYLGGRFGALITTGPNTVGIPLDLQIGANIDRFYLEGLVGPWILFTPNPVRAHVGFGFGLRTRVVSVGLELGYLTPSAMLGLRVGFQL